MPKMIMPSGTSCRAFDDGRRSNSCRLPVVIVPEYSRLPSERINAVYGAQSGSHAAILLGPSWRVAPINFAESRFLCAVSLKQNLQAGSRNLPQSSATIATLSPERSPPKTHSADGIQPKTGFSSRAFSRARVAGKQYFLRCRLPTTKVSIRTESAARSSSSR